IGLRIRVRELAEQSATCSGAGGALQASRCEALRHVCHHVSIHWSFCWARRLARARCYFVELQSATDLQLLFSLTSWPNFLQTRRRNGSESGGGQLPR